MPTEWIGLLVQAGGAVSVTGMFIWFLLNKQKQDAVARREFLDHLSDKDTRTAEAINIQMKYLRDRDSQSKEIAQTGHQSLTLLSQEVALLRQKLMSQNCLEEGLEE